MLETITMQETPNPNAMKFLMAEEVIADEGKISYQSIEECSHIPLAKTLLELDDVTQVHFFENAITVTKVDAREWESVINDVKKIIEEKGPEHDPHFKLSTEPVRPKNDNEDINKIDGILDKTIRPGLQMDGGDLEIISYEGDVLTVNYQGACGGCPSSASGTLLAIEQILKDEFNPDIKVSIAE